MSHGELLALIAAAMERFGWDDRMFRVVEPNQYRTISGYAVIVFNRVLRDGADEAEDHVFGCFYYDNRSGQICFSSSIY